MKNKLEHKYYNTIILILRIKELENFNIAMIMPHF